MCQIVRLKLFRKDLSQLSDKWGDLRNKSPATTSHSSLLTL